MRGLRLLLIAHDYIFPSSICRFVVMLLGGRTQAAYIAAIIVGMLGVLVLNRRPAQVSTKPLVMLPASARTTPPAEPRRTPSGEMSAKGVEWWGAVDDMWEIAPGAYTWNGVESDLKDMQAAGITWVRLHLYYERELAFYDELVTRTQAKGVNIVFVIWKNAPHQDLGTSQQRAAYKSWLSRAVTRYKHQVKYWEVHNEPNLGKFWNIDIDTTDDAVYSEGVRRYVAHLQDSYTAIKVADPTAKVLLGGLSEWRAERYIDELAAQGAYDYFDLFAYHPYGADPDRIISRLHAARTRLALKSEMATKAIWITEIGFHTEPNWKLPGYVASEKLKAEYLTQTMEKLREHGIQTPIFWYALDERSEQNGYGLINKNRSTLRTKYLPAYDAYRDHGTGKSQTLVFFPEADAHVKETDPEKNNGRLTYLRVDGGSDSSVESYLRFVVPHVPQRVQRATLRLYATDSTAKRPAASTTDSNWSETRIFWNDRPRRAGRVIDGGGAISRNTWVEYDVTPLVAGDGDYSFVLATTSGDGVNFNAREASANRPQLVLMIDSSVVPGPSPTPAHGPTDLPTKPEGMLGPVIMAAGDIACDPTSGAFNGGSGTRDYCRQLHTSDLLAGADAILPLGDLQYENATLAEFQQAYDHSWGRFKAKTYPGIGSHEYFTAAAAGYFDYFGAQAGARDKGYYSFDLGQWHIIALNSACGEVVGGCGTASPQYQWLAQDLQANPTTCTLAYWHHPRYSSGARQGSNVSMDPIWDLLNTHDVDVALVAHSHTYERFAPIDTVDERDDAQGLRQFVVGTGGKSLDGFGAPLPHSEVRQGDTFGVLKLGLEPTRYRWEFVPELGKTFSDTGSTACH